MTKLKLVIGFQMICILLHVHRINTSTSKIHRSPCLKDALFKNASAIGKFLDGKAGSMIASKIVGNLAKCALGCIRIPDCLSINFYKNSNDLKRNECKLMKIDRSCLGAGYRSKPGWIHYEPVKQVGPRCRWAKCNTGKKCIEDCQSQDGYKCIDIDECESNPCQNGGTCANLDNKYSCTCVPGYSGTNCETSINECESSPCKNGGTCNDLVNKYSCTCLPGYSGTNCQSDINECASNPCVNSGTCQDGFNRYTCNCLSDYSGKNCEKASLLIWAKGNAVGGSQTYLGVQSSKEACETQCSMQSLNGLLPNGITVNSLSEDVACYCQYGMTGRNISTALLSKLIEPSCHTYTFLSELNRNVGQRIGSYCDDKLNGSYRFIGQAGTKMPISCVAEGFCSTHASGWMNGAHPTVSEGIVSRQVCFAYAGSCCWFNSFIKVRNCGSFYAYYLPPSQCDYRYCSTA